MWLSLTVDGEVFEGLSRLEESWGLEIKDHSSRGTGIDAVLEMVVMDLVGKFNKHKPTKRE